MAVDEATNDHITKTVTYPGDVVNDVIGRLIGPDGLDRVWMAQIATYSPSENVTRVTMRTVSVSDLESAEFDGWGELRGTLKQSG